MSGNVLALHTGETIARATALPSRGRAAAT